jgi:RNA polymerase sigma-70 factor, ECF subfamily
LVYKQAQWSVRLGLALPASHGSQAVGFRKVRRPRELLSTRNEKGIEPMFAMSLLSNTDPHAPAAELGESIVRACQAGDRQALGQFVRCYEHRVFAYLSRTLGANYPIEDLAQEVFLRAYPALVRFNVTERPKLSTWLLSIAHRVAVDARRRRRDPGQVLDPERCPSPHPTAEQLLGQEQLHAAVSRAVDLLPAEQRDVFVLAEFHELSTAEMASVVGVSTATVKTRLFRAKSRLRLALGSLLSVRP